MNTEASDDSWPPCQKALYWDKAPRIIQEIDSADVAWVHACLHRKEGDSWNTNYWYTRAGKPFFNKSLEEEWEILWDYFSQE